MLDWIGQHDALLWTLGSVSVAMFLGTLIVVPFLIVRIPADYFAPVERQDPPAKRHRAPVRLLLHIGKNILGVIFLIAGLIMLMLPGQGILTILIGLVLLDFPGKYKLERWLVRRRPVLRSINWLRTKRGRPPLVLHDAVASGS
jgi:hypothetical protein